MTGIKQWAFSLCMAMVACGLAQMLLPRGSMGKMFRITVSVFFLCCLLSPVVLRSPDLRVQVQEYSQEDIQRRAQRLTDVVERQSASAATGGLEKITADKLDELGINYEVITIHIETKGQNGEAVPVVEIELGREYESRHDSIRRVLMAELGLEVRLGYV